MEHRGRRISLAIGFGPKNTQANGVVHPLLVTVGLAIQRWVVGVLAILLAIILIALQIGTGAPYRVRE